MSILVSIVTPVFNSECYVADAINSLLNQTYQFWELILVDDCSDDSSISVIHSFIAMDSRIKLVELSQNSGAAVARNKGIEFASGRYIAFLDSDDLWLADKLQKQLVFMQENNYPFSFTAYDKVDVNGHVFGHIGVPEKVSYTDLLKMCSIGCLTVMYDTHYFGKVTMPLIRKRQDLGLWLKLLKKTDFAYGLNESLAHYRVRSDSISSNKSIAAKFTWRLYREIEGLSLIKASYYFSHYAVRGLLRTKAPSIARFLGILE